jgi:hypothetical protein
MPYAQVGATGTEEEEFKEENGSAHQEVVLKTDPLKSRKSKEVSTNIIHSPNMKHLGRI